MRTYETAESRWVGVGPYYAMFPSDFADSVVREYTQEGDTVLDPFAGRGTAVYSAAIHRRHGIGIELNPVGWVYAKAKLRPADKATVTMRVEQLGELASRYASAARALPRFFHRCFSCGVRRFLMAARDLLDWRRSRVDQTAMALLLVNLHGKREASLSNQMRQTKSMSPDYSIDWWDKHDLDPPDVDPVEFMLKRIEWRYAKGIPTTSESHAYLGDSLDVLDRVRDTVTKKEQARLLFTSPPYLRLTNYHYDQWLRLWLLGGAPNALRSGEPNRGKFEHPERYKSLLLTVFRKAAACLTDDATVYVRTGRDAMTRSMTRDSLRAVFPKKNLVEHDRPFERPTQTRLFGDVDSPSGGEVDFVLRAA